MPFDAPPTEAASFVTWEAPASCPTAAEVEARVRERTQAPPRPVTVRVEPNDQPSAPAGEVRVRMTTEGGGDRSFVAPSCDEAATAVALIVALAARAAEQAAPAPAPLPPLPPPPAPVAAERPLPSPKEDAWAWSIGLGGAIDTGSLPATAPGAMLGIEVRRPKIFTAGLRAQAFVPQTARDAAPATATIALFDVMPEGCVLLPFARILEGGPCVGAGLGILPGSSDNVTQPRSAIGFRAEGSLAARLGARLGAWGSIRTETGMLLDPIRSPFRVAGLGEIYRPPLVTFRMGIGLNVRFR